MNKNAAITGVLFLVVFVVGFAIGRMSTGETTIAEDVSGVNDFAQTLTPNANNDNTQSSGEPAGGGATVNTANLTDGQRKMLQALGIDADNITITAEMVACAEAKLGAARIEEIKNGATPSFSEGASLVACYR
jgi:hypothetical protein